MPALLWTSYNAMNIRKCITLNICNLLLLLLSFRMTVCYVSDHWAQYVAVAGASSPHVHTLSLDKLQLEYDHLFLRAVLHVLRNKR